MNNNASRCVSKLVPQRPNIQTDRPTDRLTSPIVDWQLVALVWYRRDSASDGDIDATAMWNEWETASVRMTDR